MAAFVQFHLVSVGIKLGRWLFFNGNVNDISTLDGGILRNYQRISITQARNGNGLSPSQSGRKFMKSHLIESSENCIKFRWISLTSLLEANRQHSESTNINLLKFLMVLFCSSNCHWQERTGANRFSGWFCNAKQIFSLGLNAERLTWLVQLFDVWQIFSDLTHKSRSTNERINLHQFYGKKLFVSTENCIVFVFGFS